MSAKEALANRDGALLQHSDAGAIAKRSGDKQEM